LLNKATFICCFIRQIEESSVTSKNSRRQGDWDSSGTGGIGTLPFGTILTAGRRSVWWALRVFSFCRGFPSLHNP
jgi:hypothetical protein